MKNDGTGFLHNREIGKGTIAKRAGMQPEGR